jgi:hypothetical protein
MQLDLCTNSLKPSLLLVATDRITNQNFWFFRCETERFESCAKDLVLAFLRKLEEDEKLKEVV